MAMSGPRQQEGSLADINVTPMADIMIVLLIIFMVATPLVAKAPVPLPEASNTAKRDSQELKVIVDVGGRVQVGTLSFADLGAFRHYLTEVVEGSDVTTVLVLGHREARYTEISRVLDACRQAGVPTVALATDPRLN